MVKGICPECDAAVPFEAAPKRGQQVTCPSCGATLTVLTVSPLELDWAFEEPFDESIYSDAFDEPLAEDEGGWD